MSERGLRTGVVLMGFDMGLISLQYLISGKSPSLQYSSIL